LIHGKAGEKALLFLDGIFESLQTGKAIIVTILWLIRASNTMPLNV